MSFEEEKEMREMRGEKNAEKHAEQHTQRRTFQVIGALIALAIAFSLGSLHARLSDSSLSHPSTPSILSATVTEADIAPFWKAWSVIDAKFVSASGTPSTNNRIWGAIKGLAASTKDPYTMFFNPEESKMFQNEVAGNFEGVGMEIDVKDDMLTVVAPLKGSPAFKAGVKPGDKIIKINDVVADFGVEKAIQMIRGPKGTKVTILVARAGGQEPFTITMTRDVIVTTEVEYEDTTPPGAASTTPSRHAVGLRSDGIFVIRLNSFTETSPDQFRKALRSFVESKSHQLILDLRGNPGGYLSAAVDIASWFLPRGALVVTEDFGKNAAKEEIRSKGYNVFGKSLKMAILIDGGSASAAEILAGALREYGTAVLVGQKSFGKGSVQELVPITTDTTLKVTVARWLTPKGHNLSAGGLLPDYEVKEKDMKAAITAHPGVDPVLERAVEILHTMK
jgi:carboxyl-terminal processing protease